MGQLAMWQLKRGRGVREDHPDGGPEVWEGRKGLPHPQARASHSPVLAAEPGNCAGNGQKYEAKYAQENVYVK